MGLLGNYCRSFSAADKPNTSSQRRSEKKDDTEEFRLLFADRWNPLKYLYHQNFGVGSTGSAGGGNYSGFTGNLSGGPTERGPGAGRGSRGGGSSGGSSSSGSSDLHDFYRLPQLTKQDQVEIIAELT